MSEEAKGVVKEKVTGRPEIFVREWFADFLCLLPGLSNPRGSANDRGGAG